MSDDVYLREHLVSLLPVGREFAVSAKDLAFELGCSTRTVGQLVEAAIIEDGFAVGSRCDGRPGYFLIVDAEDLRVGAAHIINRAAQSFKRVRALERNFEAMNAGQTHLFADFAKAVSGS